MAAGPVEATAFEPAARAALLAFALAAVARDEDLGGFEEAGLMVAR
jgi:hypothetical protein